MQQQVTVIAIEKRDAIVRGNRASACGDCAGKTSCSTIGSWKERFIELRVHNSVGAGIGDRVLLEVPDSAVMKIAFRLYALPMLAFILAGLGMQSMATWLAWPEVEAVAALSGFAAVIAYYLWYKFYLSSHQNNLDVQMVRVIHCSTPDNITLDIPLRQVSPSD
ncbi:MAG: SoxR reducing system RseC family protein [Mariprofundus sp.]|nr:SoxR reducing system RseC family protein [Mariprofundus sp.]